MRMITENDILNLFWNNNILYNRCYIYRPYENMLYLKFDNPIQLEYLIERFRSQCAYNKLDCSLVIIEHREFVRGQLKTDFDYVISIPNEVE